MIDNYKITNDLENSIYEVVHAPAARSYWANKWQVDKEVIKDIN
jgi:HD superfamily phosphohydrolase YqeK